jgi:quinol monooxygenase YgiN
VYGLIGKLHAVPGGRDELAALLGEMGKMPGCRSYVVALDPEDPEALWVTEVWDSIEAHRASLELPAVREAIAAGAPMIAGFSERIETEPIGGAGFG